MSSFGNKYTEIFIPNPTPFPPQPHLGLDFEMVSSNHAFIALLRAREE